ncbi:MAG: SDR family oxidoreductase [Rhizobiaceae bacterium]|nr:SDR family oxidoreductase [Rhizobiaceae bacterium]
MQGQTTLRWPTHSACGRDGQKRRFYRIQACGKGTPENRLDEITRIAGNVPLGHIVHPEQIAQTVLFVASEAAAYITGTDIAVDGGTSMPRRIDAN